MVKIAVIGICGRSDFLTVDHFHANGETVKADKLFEEFGGKGMNQAIAAARMGADVSFLAAVGEDPDADRCRQILLQNGITPYLVAKEGFFTARGYILTDKTGENRVTIYNSAQLDVSDVENFEQAIADSDILLLQQEVPPEINVAASELAKKHHVKVILNPAPISPTPVVLADTVYAVTPNEQEVQGLNVQHFQNCITTLGSKGCLINNRQLIPADVVKAVDTTGAGDTFNGVFAVLVAEGASLEKACRYAVTAATLSVTKPYVLNAIPYREETEQYLKGENSDD